MSLYEGLSLVLSTLGTLFTVYIGFRQLRQPAGAQPVPAGAPHYLAPGHGPGAGYRPEPVRGTGGAPVYGAAGGMGGAPPAYGVAQVPTGPTLYGRAPVAPSPYPTSGAPVSGAPISGAPISGAPTSGAPTSGPPRPYGGPYSGAYNAPYGAPFAPAAAVPARRVRPKSVTAASVLLFIAAALQPLTLLAFYGIEYAIDAEAAAEDLSGAGVVDVTVFGIIAVLCGIIGIMVARGSRVAAWIVWILGLLGVPFALLTIAALVFTLLSPAEGQDPAGLLAVVVIYLVFVFVAIAASAALLINSKARDFFFKRA